MTRAYTKWTEEEFDIIRLNYQTKDINWITELIPAHTKMSIAKQVQKLSLSKPQPRKCTLQPLVEFTPQAYYWIGFFLADAHFSDRAITITFSSKDISHIEKLKQFLNADNAMWQVGESDCYRIKFGDTSVVKNLKERFNIHANKTKNPCNISNIEDDLFFALIVGYIDGDGCITKSNKSNSHTLAVVGDESCLDTFKLMFNFIHSFTNVEATNQIPYLKSVFTSLPQDKENKRHFTNSTWYITNKTVLRRMKQTILKLNLPYMERKWDKL